MVRSLFCPKCGSILIPEKVNGKTKLKCLKCGYSTYKIDINTTTKEKINKELKEIKVIEDNLDRYTIAKVECPKCGNKKAKTWVIQTRASDEGETRFFECTKCGYRWRSYE